ncbi:hypothetical protein LCGC14_0124310 [marine sediment metagenome]|uniref:DUF1680 family protein n=1 Tax=marine sediment metagenome TaxID=412755 RepID=A0A0F9XMP0_9ZZZZ|nr:hypothetical protein [Phycisphaerae bacterium]HDZ42331.1 hypothetical protein [Phycisphaerae bacterium]
MSELKLNPTTFAPLPLGSVRPEGWLKRQLRIQANGISGKLDEFWPDVMNSQWFGGESEGWERAPYWLDGAIPLAFLLDDEALKAKVIKYMEYILEHQQEDGWLGPRDMKASDGDQTNSNYDVWGQLLATKVLALYHEVVDDDRVLRALEVNLRKIEAHIDTSPLWNWGAFRWFETLLAIYLLFEETGEQWLLDLAVTIHAQGFDWRSFFARFHETKPTRKDRWNYMGHVVNCAMAIKAPGLWWRVSGDEGDRAAVYDIIDKLDDFHGMVTGVMSGDECIAGTSPSQGTELCAVVEYQFSLEVLLSVMGDPAFGDRLEKITFNALPATFSPDMWSHQYDQQVNQVECSVVENRRWNTNGADANTFGVEPNYGCCTANLSQGWPKFAMNLWMKTDDDGLAAVAYGPSRVTTDLAGTPVTVVLDTEYPFRDSLRFTVTAEKPTSFPLVLRIPAWAAGATVQVAGGEAAVATPGTFHRIEREWSGSTEVLLTLPMAAKLTRRPNNAVAVERGPLIYSLKMGETWKRINEDKPYRELPHADWEVLPTTPWNYALEVDESSIASDVTFAESPVGDMPFSPDQAPVRATVKGRRVPTWQMENGSAQDVPAGPVECADQVEELTLIPYGCTNLRVTEFPVVKR